MATDKLTVSAAVMHSIHLNGYQCYHDSNTCYPGKRVKSKNSLNTTCVVRNVFSYSN